MPPKIVPRPKIKVALEKAKFGLKKGIRKAGYKLDDMKRTISNLKPSKIRARQMQRKAIKMSNAITQREQAATEAARLAREKQGAIKYFNNKNKNGELAPTRRPSINRNKSVPDVSGSRYSFDPDGAIQQRLNDLRRGSSASFNFESDAFRRGSSASLGGNKNLPRRPSINRNKSVPDVPGINKSVPDVPGINKNLPPVIDMDRPILDMDIPQPNPGIKPDKGTLLIDKDLPLQPAIPPYVMPPVYTGMERRNMSTPNLPGNAGSSKANALRAQRAQNRALADTNAFNLGSSTNMFSTPRPSRWPKNPFRRNAIQGSSKRGSQSSSNPLVQGNSNRPLWVTNAILMGQTAADIYNVAATARGNRESEERLARSQEILQDANEIQRLSDIINDPASTPQQREEARKRITELRSKQY